MSVFSSLHIPSLGGATEWLNSEPLGPAEVRGHVVLVDLWTLTCINWLCTKPYVRGDARAQPRPSALVPRHSRLVAHALARIHSVSRSVVEERRLADAGVAPHDKCTAAAGARRIERSVDDCAFGRAHAEPLRLRRHS
jgi:hypothetical protein